MDAILDTWSTARRTDITGPDVAKILWIGAGIFFCGLALLGALLPVMPTTVFVLGAAACFSKGSPRLERWLLDHPTLGPGLRAWRAERAIPARAKVAALVSMAGSALLVSLTAPTLVALAVVTVLGMVAAYVATRPTPRAALATVAAA